MSPPSPGAQKVTWWQKGQLERSRVMLAGSESIPDTASPNEVSIPNSPGDAQREGTVAAVCGFPAQGTAIIRCWKKLE